LKKKKLKGLRIFKMIIIIIKRRKDKKERKRRVLTKGWAGSGKREADKGRTKNG